MATEKKKTSGSFILGLVGRLVPLLSGNAGARTVARKNAERESGAGIRTASATARRRNPKAPPLTKEQAAAMERMRARTAILAPASPIARRRLTAPVAEISKTPERDKVGRAPGTARRDAENEMLRSTASAVPEDPSEASRKRARDLARADAELRRRNENANPSRQTAERKREDLMRRINGLLSEARSRLDPRRDKELRSDVSAGEAASAAWLRSSPASAARPEAPIAAMRGENFETQISPTRKDPNAERYSGVLKVLSGDDRMSMPIQIEAATLAREIRLAEKFRFLPEQTTQPIIPPLRRERDEAR